MPTASRWSLPTSRPRSVTAILDAIDHDAYMEVQRAIQAHQTARAEALDGRKKNDDGAPSPDRTLTSVA